MNECVTGLIENPTAKLIVVGFSPTGGGHTARLLNIINLALINRSIPAGSIILFHLPCRWEGSPRSPLIADLAMSLLAHNIHVLMAEADKSIYGYLNQQTGGSDDASILQRITHYPLRNLEQNSILTVDSFVSFRNKEDIEVLPIISAKNLMERVVNTFGAKIIKEQCYILTDMDPYLQKAAIGKGVPSVRCLDQQNHAILLDLKRVELNLLPKYALLSKVLGGYGESISHIDLGGLNTLNNLVPLAKQLNIDIDTPKMLTRMKVAGLLIKYALNDVQIDAKIADKNKLFTGVIVGPQIHRSAKPGNIIYIYAHKKTNIIANCIVECIRAGEPAFQDVIFLFCGIGAVGNINAMHLAYLADADGITTAGAGTIGEYAYLHRRAQCTARLLILPIEEHNEQEKNADVLFQDGSIRPYIMRAMYKESLSAVVLRFLKGQPKTVDSATMGEFINAVSDSNTYQKQACDILFTAAPIVDFNNIIEIERLMNKDPLLKATRKYLKLVFQALDAADNSPYGIINISLKQGENIIFSGVKELAMKFYNPISLGHIIGLMNIIEVMRLPLFREVQSHFSAIASGMHPSSSKLKEKFGKYMITGF